MAYDDLPVCCQNCTRLESDYSEFSDQWWWYCIKNLWWPVRTQTCKKQVPYQRSVKPMPGAGEDKEDQ